MTREEWLVAAIDLLRLDFETAGATIPEKVRVTCGWPSRGGRAEKQQVLGECWPPTCSEDEHTEIFIAPTLGEGMEALDVLVHELVHAAVGTEAGHKGQFRVVAKAIGLEGKMTEAKAGEVLLARLREVAVKLGKYPHKKLTPTNKKPQSTRMLKITCEDCGYLVRTSQKWVDTGLPTCCCGGKMLLEELEETEE